MSKAKGKYAFYDETMEDLEARRDWEQRIAQLHAQYYGLDRPDVMTYPWPHAANQRFLLAQMTISRQLPLRSKLITASKNIVTLTSRKKEMMSKAPMMSQFFDFYTKNRTNFIEQKQYSDFQEMHNGLRIMKTVFDVDLKRVCHESINPIFFIVPGDTHDIHESPRVVHILQKSEGWVKKRFKDSPDFDRLESFLRKMANGGSDLEESDSGDSEKHKYDRMGISRSKARTKVVTLWERHYLDDDDGKRKMTYILPDEPSIKLCESFEYPYESMAKRHRYMFEVGKYEKIDPHIYSSQGITEKATEVEYSLTAMWRALLNTIQIYSSPVFYPTTPDSLPSTTQNLDFSPGSILPVPLQKVDMGDVPVEFVEQINFQRGFFERWIGTPDYGLGKANTLGEARTATEIKALTFQSNLNVGAELENDKEFTKRVLENQLGLLNEFKGQIEDWDYITKEGFESFSAKDFSDEYYMEVNGNADSLNREAQLNNAIALLNLALQGGPQVGANLPELFKNVVENAEPERVERFTLQGGEAQAQSARDALIDLASVITTGQMSPMMNGDLKSKAMAAVGTLQHLMRSGASVDPQIVAKIGQYLVAIRDQLKKTDKQGYEQVTGVLDQMDQAAHSLVGGGQEQPQLQQNGVM